MVNCLTRILDDLRSGERSLLVTGEDEKKIRWISFSGNRRRKENHHGYPHGVTVVRAGISNAQRCPRNILVNRLISMQVVKTLCSRIMKMKSHRVRRQMAKEFASYWMHNGFLNIDNKKMSKSLGNFRTVREIKASSMIFRYCVSSC